MSKIDIDALLQELDPAAPSGPDLEYDPVFLALELAVLGKPEVQYGDSLTPAVPPDWKAVRNMAVGLIERSRDLRLAMHLLRANLVLSGIAGMADGLRLIERLLDERWDSVHPQLDADDDLDPTLRINSLASLADSTSIVKELKEATLLVLPGLGPLSMRLLDITSGELPVPDGQEKIPVESIERAVADAEESTFRAALETLTQAHNSAVNIETLLVRQVGSSQALNLDALTRPLKRSRDFLQRQADARFGSADSAAAEAEAEAAAAAAGTASAADGSPAEGGAPRAAPISGQIANRADVIRMLDKLTQYYQQHEPASPVPLLLERARRLVPMSFLEVMEDLAPSGIAQLMVIKGPAES
jgi:type VI secretion system protein ImpA